jgi:hypothetical protein
MKPIEDLHHFLGPPALLLLMEVKLYLESSPDPFNIPIERSRKVTPGSNLLLSSLVAAFPLPIADHCIFDPHRGPLFDSLKRDGGPNVHVANQLLIANLPYFRKGQADILLGAEFGSIDLNRQTIDVWDIVGDLVHVRLDQLDILVTEVDGDSV